MKVSDLKGFPEKKDTTSPIVHKSEMLKALKTGLDEGFNNAREIIGSLPLPCEPLEYNKILKEYDDYIESVRKKSGQHIPNDFVRRDLLIYFFRYICQKFGTSAVGTPKHHPIEFSDGTSMCSADCRICYPESNKRLDAVGTGKQDISDCGCGMGLSCSVAKAISAFLRGSNDLS